MRRMRAITMAMLILIPVSWFAGATASASRDQVDAIAQAPEITDGPTAGRRVGREREFGTHGVPVRTGRIRKSDRGDLERFDRLVRDQARLGLDADDAQRLNSLLAM